MIAVAAGIAAAGWLPQLPSTSSALAALLVVAALALACRRISPFAVQIIFCISIGWGWGTASGNRAMQAWLPVELEGVDFWLYGVVDSLPEFKGRALQFELKVTGQCFVLHPDGCADSKRVLSLRRVLLSYYGQVAYGEPVNEKPGHGNQADGGQVLTPGQLWRLRVRLNRPHGLANPGGFDYELMLLQKGIDARGYVRETSFNQLLDQRLTLQWLRFRLWQRLQAATAVMPQRGIIMALVLGDRSGISDENWELFTRTGTNHLVVISGLHVGFMAAVSYWLINLLARLLPWLLLRIPAQKLGALGAIAGAAIYALMAGFSLPTQRALIMVSVFMAGRLLAREFPVSLGYITALLLVLILDPLGAMSAGFWLSFVAVASLLLAFSCWIEHREFLEPEPEGWRQWLWQVLRARLRWSVWGRPQWVVFVGMSVPLILWLQQVSLTSPLANIIAIPLVSLLVVPLCLCGLLMLYVFEPFGMLLLGLADQLLSLLLWVLANLVELLPEGLLQFVGLRQVAYPFAALGCLLLLLPRGWPGRGLAGVLLLPLLLPARMPVPADGEAWVTVLDVGQGLAVLVQTAEHALLYDSGPGFVDGFDAGRTVIAPLLRRRGIRRLDRVMISHGDNDHAGGLPSVLEAVPADEVFAGTPLARLPAGPAVQPCRAGQSWQWDKVRFEVLHPGPATYRQRNDNSCVLRVSSSAHSLLLTGDIEAAEAELLRAHGDSLQSDYLVAPHHGSNSSSSQAFINAVRPRHVIFPAGYRNQFAHPATVVQQRYREAGALLYNTASSGALMLTLAPDAGSSGVASGVIEGDSPAPRAWRQQRRRFWYIDTELMAETELVIK